MIAGALNADPAKFESKSAKSVRSRVGNIKDFLPESIGIQEFWNRMLDELSRDGMTREELTENGNWSSYQRDNAPEMNV